MKTLLLVNAWGRARFGPYLLAARALTRGRLADRRLHVIQHSGYSREWLPTSDGKVAAACWLASGAAQGPALIVVHGSRGPLPLYSLLAESLLQQGITVLLLELPGFGRSPAPAAPWQVDQFTGHAAIVAGLSWLCRQPRVDPQRVSLFGHSFGGSVVASTACSIPGLHTVIALGPTRRVEQRFVGPSANESLFWRARFALARRLYPWPDAEFVRAVTRAVALEYRLENWQRNDHLPLLLIDGELESRRDRDFLESLAKRIGKSATYRTVPAADHYLNTTGIGRLAFYDSRAIDTCVRWIMEWIREHAGSCTTSDQGYV